MYDPWDDFEPYRLAGWAVRWEPMDGCLGLVTWHDTTVRLATDQDQRQERGSLTHEVVHIERGPIPIGWEEWEERIVDEIAARRLISLEDLVDGMLWAYDIEELAVVLWVDEPTVRTRLRTLTEAEGREIQARLDQAEARFPDEMYDDRDIDISWRHVGLDWNSGHDQNGDIELEQEAG